MRNDDPLKTLISVWFVFFVVLACFVMIMTFMESEIDNLQQQIDILKAQLTIEEVRP